TFLFGRRAPYASPPAFSPCRRRSHFVSKSRRSRALAGNTRAKRPAALVVENAFRMELGEMLLIRRLLFLGHDGWGEMRLRRRDAAAELDLYANVAHRHLRPGNCAENHEVVEVAEMADAENFSGDLR